MTEDINESKEITEAKQQILTLREEIVKLKSDNNAKINDLVEIHSRELEIMKKDNITLSKEIQESKVSLDVTLALKDEEIQKALKERDFEKAHTIKFIESANYVVEKNNGLVKDINIISEDRRLARLQMSEVLKSPLNKACHCCGKIFSSEIEIKEHTNNFRGYCFACKVCFKPIYNWDLKSWDLVEHTKCPGVSAT